MQNAKYKRLGKRLCCTTKHSFSNLPRGFIAWVSVMKLISTCSLTLDQGKLEPAIKCLFISAESRIQKAKPPPPIKPKVLQPESKVIKWFSFIESKLTCFTLLAASKFDHITWRRGTFWVLLSETNKWKHHRTKANPSQRCFLLMSQQRLCFPCSIRPACTGPKRETHSLWGFFFFNYYNISQTNRE